MGGGTPEMVQTRRARSAEDLLRELRAGEGPFRAEILHFIGVEDRDVYNITPPFCDAGRWLIAGRVENRRSEVSEVYFFAENERGDWELLPDTPIFSLQDPFVARVQGELVLGGVETFIHPRGVPPRFWWWRTILFRGSDVRSLRPFFYGPDGMKDIRLVELKDGRIGVFTRPQGKIGGRGKIGFFTVGSLDELRPDLFESAPILESLFLDEEWGGVNEAQLLPDGRLAVIGHIARFADEATRYRDYYALAFVFDPVTLNFTDVRIIAERRNFVEGPAKREDVANVVFPGGLVRNPDGTAVLYAGVSDAGAQRLFMPDVFRPYGLLPNPLHTPCGPRIER